MSLFTKSTGEEVAPTKSFVNTGIQELIPAGTQLLCNVASATWEPADSYNAEHVKIMLHVVERGKYKDFTVNQKIKVLDKDSKVSDKAKDMLGAYDANAKGVLMAAHKAGKDATGNNALLARALNGASIVAEMDIYEIERKDGTMMTGNFVRGISPAPRSIQEEDKAIISKEPAFGNITEEDLEDADDDDYFRDAEDIETF